MSSGDLQKIINKANKNWAHFIKCRKYYFKNQNFQNIYKYKVGLLEIRKMERFDKFSTLKNYLKSEF